MYILLKNKKLNLNYSIVDKVECGIVLKGHEVKSVVKSNANIDQAFVTFKQNEAYLINMYVAPYLQASTNAIDPDRSRKLLLNKREIIKLQYKIKKEHMTIVPNLVYLKKDNIKIEICLVKSKNKQDKRLDNKIRDEKREIKSSY